MQISNYHRRLSILQAAQQFRLVPEKHIAHRRMETFLVHRRGTRAERRELRLGVIPEWAHTEAARLLDYDRQSPHAFTAGIAWRVLDGLALAA